MNLSEETKQRLMSELICLADTEWVLGHWYIKNIKNGRSIPDFSSMAAIGQDELGHTRALFRFLEDFRDLPEFQLEFGRSADQVHNLSCWIILPGIGVITSSAS